MVTALTWRFRSGIYQSSSGDAPRRESILVSTKNYISWYSYLVDFYVSNKIQSGEYSMDGGIDKCEYESAPAS